MDLRVLSVLSKGSERPLTDIFYDKTSPQAYSILDSQLGYGNEWQQASPLQAVRVKTMNKP